MPDLNTVVETARLVIKIQNVNIWDQLQLVLSRNVTDERGETCFNRFLVFITAT